MGRSKQVFVSSPVYSVVPLFLRLFIDKSSLLEVDTGVSVYRGQTPRLVTRLPLDLPSTPVMTYP